MLRKFVQLQVWQLFIHVHNYYLTGSDFGLTGDGCRMISAAFYRNREDVCVCVGG